MGWLISANLNAKVIIKLETDKKIDKKIDKKMANDIIKNYMRYLKLERNYSLNTLEAYRHDLDYLMEYARNNDKGVLEMKLEDLENFSASLHDKGISATSHARVLCGVRSFYRYLVIDDYLKDDPTELLPSPQIGEHLPEYLSVEEVDMLESAIDLSKWEGQRNKAIIAMIALLRCPSHFERSMADSSISTSSTERYSGRCSPICGDGKSSVGSSFR